MERVESYESSQVFNAGYFPPRRYLAVVSEIVVGPSVVALLPFVDALIDPHQVIEDLFQRHLNQKPHEDL